MIGSRPHHRHPDRAPARPTRPFDPAPPPKTEITRNETHPFRGTTRAGGSLSRGRAITAPVAGPACDDRASSGADARTGCLQRGRRTKRTGSGRDGRGVVRSRCSRRGRLAIIGLAAGPFDDRRARSGVVSRRRWDQGTGSARDHRADSGAVDRSSGEERGRRTMKMGSSVAGLACDHRADSGVGVRSWWLQRGRLAMIARGAGAEERDEIRGAVWLAMIGSPP